MSVEPSPPLSDFVGMVAVHNLESQVEELQAGLTREKLRYPTCKEYLANEDSRNELAPSSGTGSDPVTSNWRHRILDWIFEVVDHFGFDREVCSIALDYLDRSVSLTTEKTKQHLSKREFQLFAVTSLYIAIKLHGEAGSTEGPRIKLKVSAFEDLSRRIFDVATIEATELRLLELLRWRVNPPTAPYFIASMLQLLPSWTGDQFHSPYHKVKDEIYNIAKYLAELSCFVPSFSFFHRPSLVAYTAIFCAVESMRSTMPLPQDIELEFLACLEATSTGFAQDSEEVLRIQRQLKDLAPSLFENQTPRLARVASDMDTEAHRSSPVDILGAYGPPQKKLRMEV